METLPEQPEQPDPVVQFVINGLRLSIQQNMMTREQAEEKIRSWWPDAQIVSDEYNLPVIEDYQ